VRDPLYHPPLIPPMADDPCDSSAQIDLSLPEHSPGPRLAERGHGLWRYPAPPNFADCCSSQARCSLQVARYSPHPVPELLRTSPKAADLPPALAAAASYFPAFVKNRLREYLPLAPAAHCRADYFHPSSAARPHSHAELLPRCAPVRCPRDPLSVAIHLQSAHYYARPRRALFVLLPRGSAPRTAAWRYVRPSCPPRNCSLASASPKCCPPWRFSTTPRSSAPRRDLPLVHSQIHSSS
jgi:hypothetical protein